MADSLAGAVMGCPTKDWLQATAMDKLITLATLPDLLDKCFAIKSLAQQACCLRAQLGAIIWRLDEC